MKSYIDYQIYLRGFGLIVTIPDRADAWLGEKQGSGYDEQQGAAAALAGAVALGISNAGRLPKLPGKLGGGGNELDGIKKNLTPDRVRARGI